MPVSTQEETQLLSPEDRRETSHSLNESDSQRRRFDKTPKPRRQNSAIDEVDNESLEVSEERNDSIQFDA